MVSPALKLYRPPPDEPAVTPPTDYVLVSSNLVRELLDGGDTLQALNTRILREFNPADTMIPGLRTEILELWAWHLQRVGWAYLVCQAMAAEDGDDEARRLADLHRQVAAHLKARVLTVLEKELPMRHYLGGFGAAIDRAPEKLGNFMGVSADQHRQHAVPNLRMVLRHTRIILDVADPFESLESSWMIGWGSVPEDGNQFSRGPVEPLFCATR
jgi:hypothetical protein